MIRRIRATATARPTDFMQGLFSNLIASAEVAQPVEDTDPAIDVLLRNAMRQERDVEPDSARVWRNLRNKVRGPFGRLAVEGPGLSAPESALMDAGGHSEQMPFTVTEQPGTHYHVERRHVMTARDRLPAELFKSDESALMMR